MNQTVKTTLSTLLPALWFASFALSPVLAADTPVAKTVVEKVAFDKPIVFAGDSSPHRFSEVAGKTGTALVFMGTECPISKRYAPEVAAIGQDYAAQGIKIVLVYPNAGAKKADVLAQAKAWSLDSLPLLMDTTQELTDSVGATTTPEAALLDTSGNLRYRGRIDDAFAGRTNPRTSGATTHDLRQAIDALLAGKTGPVTTVAAVGCVIERGGKPIVGSMIAKATVPTFAENIAPILNKNCVSCHRSGEIGPMSLASYDDAKKYVTNIASVTQAKLMPPWKPVAGHGDFAGERRLTETEVDMLKRWADAGAPQGDPAKTPPTPTFTAGWQLGKPDLVLTMPQAWKVGQSDPDVYRCFVLPTNLTEDKDVVGVEYRAGNKSVVHHVIGYIDVAGAGRERDAKEDGPGYTAFGGPGFMPYGELGGWAPGNLPHFLPDGIGRKLPAGSDLVMQVHYHSDGKPEEDITQVGIYFAKKPVTRPYRIIPVAVPKLQITPGDANYTVSQTYPVPVDATIYQVTPHMHLLGRKIAMTATLPDGKEIPLVQIDDWDFKWQDSYTYKEPVHLPKGSKVTLTATYDNSTANPRNPNSPPKPVTWGEATTDEMCIGFLGFTADNEDDPLIKFYDALRQRRGQSNTEGDKKLKEAVKQILGKDGGTK